jgi:hypothetical protein
MSSSKPPPTLIYLKPLENNIISVWHKNIYVTYHINLLSDIFVDNRQNTDFCSHCFLRKKTPSLSFGHLIHRIISTSYQSFMFWMIIMLCIFS